MTKTVGKVWWVIESLNAHTKIYWPGGSPHDHPNGDRYRGIHSVLNPWTTDIRKALRFEDQADAIATFLAIDGDDPGRYIKIGIRCLVELDDD